MSTNAVRGIDTGVAPVDMKFEIVVIPVSDVSRAKEFYAKLGWRLDADFDNGKDFRIIQFTPSGSGCSVIFGKNVTPAAPGSAQGLYLIVSDIENPFLPELIKSFERAAASSGLELLLGMTNYEQKKAEAFALQALTLATPTVGVLAGRIIEPVAGEGDDLRCLPGFGDAGVGVHHVACGVVFGRRT